MAVVPYGVFCFRYRLVPGDQCDAEGTGAVTKDTQSKAQATGQACDEGDPGSYLDMETVKLVST